MTKKTDIDALDPIYFANDHNVDREVFQPICRATTFIRCMTGYFTSGSLRELSQSLAYFLKAQETPIRFIVSPNFTPEDLDAFDQAIKSQRNLLPLLFPGFEPTEESLKSRSVEALSYLVASGRMEFKIAIQSSGLFHTKCWLFNTEQGTVAVHGSVNATTSGFSVNTEQFCVDKDWESHRSETIVHKIDKKFESLWANDSNLIETFDLNEMTISQLRKIHDQIPNRPASDLQAWKRLKEAIEDSVQANTKKNLRVPDWLDYQSGAYSHQGEAISAWSPSGRGILSIATGGGKTLTALVAASLASEKEQGLLVVIAVPTKALLNQWAKDVEAFSIEPVNSLGKARREIKRALKGQIRNVRLGITRTEVIILTHDGLKSDLIDVLESASESMPIMLIGDEVHNLGSIGFQQTARQCFKYRLGLSATAERQFDEEGSVFLKEYFGPVVFDFPLESAIGRCLVPYSYHVHKVVLDEIEEEQWAELTYQIRKLNYAVDLPDATPEKERWKLLCLQRRRIVESANGKIIALASTLPVEALELKRSLIFCTDKDPEQLNAVNTLLRNRSVKFHQVTASETSSKDLLNKVIDSFASGELQTLTSKRVLDEGFNVPQTETAYFLASNTVRRQWIQRLGRVLRLSPETGKKHAYVHDFVVTPTISDGETDPDLKGLIQGEFERVSFFSSLSTNGLERGGSMELMSGLLKLLENVK